ncbi:LysR family transcriptional regulator [Algirhabdus cladophorae]|uniref:LysR family transcriptional regulator n=1 Tax=Algirhabdus cladophorae TaxID=3377108 RepID=UPI003B84543B
MFALLPGKGTVQARKVLTIRKANKYASPDLIIRLGRTMIEKLRNIAIFSTVVEQGTFRAAALYLGLAPSRVSEIVSDLEADLGVTLLYRTTRQLSMTAEGVILHEQAKAMLAAAETGLDAINPASHDPNGMLRITAPAFVTQTELIDHFAAFAKAYPKIELRFDFSDSPRDLIAEGYDLGLRVGWGQENVLKSRKLGKFDRLLVASPDYMASRKTPTHALDLKDWDWIGFDFRPDYTEMTSPTGEAFQIREKSRLSTNSADSLYEFAVRGLGISAIPENLACRGFDRGELVHVLPGWKPRGLWYQALWPDQSRRENLTTLLVQFLADAHPNP